MLKTIISVLKEVITEFKEIRQLMKEPPYDPWAEGEDYWTKDTHNNCCYSHMPDGKADD